MTQSNSLERTKIQQSLYAILGQDYKHSHAPASNTNCWAARPFGKGRARYMSEEPCDDDNDDTAYFEDNGARDHEAYKFDADTVPVVALDPNANGL